MPREKSNVVKIPKQMKFTQETISGIQKIKYLKSLKGENLSDSDIAAEAISFLLDKKYSKDLV